MRIWNGNRSPKEDSISLIVSYKEAEWHIDSEGYSTTIFSQTYSRRSCGFGSLLSYVYIYLKIRNTFKFLNSNVTLSLSIKKTGNRIQQKILYLPRAVSLFGMHKS